MDTQQIRNAYRGRHIGMSAEEMAQDGEAFGHFAERYLGVKDAMLRSMYNVNEVCNYILACGYNNLTKPVFPEVPNE